MLGGGAQKPKVRVEIVGDPGWRRETNRIFFVKVKRETVERCGQSSAPSFDIGFLECPIAEERLVEAIGGCGAQGCELAGSETVLGEFRCCPPGLKPLDVYADHACLRNRKHD